MGEISSTSYNSVRIEEIKRELEEEKKKPSADRNQVKCVQLWMELESLQESQAKRLLILLFASLLFVFHAAFQFLVGRIGLGSLFLFTSMDQNNCNMIKSKILYLIGSGFVAVSPFVWCFVHQLWLSYILQDMRDFGFYSLLISAGLQSILQIGSRYKVFMASRNSLYKKLGIHEIDTNLREAAVLGNFLYKEEAKQDEYLAQALPSTDERGSNICNYVFSVVDQSIAMVGFGFLVSAFLIFWIAVEWEELPWAANEVYYTCEIECLAVRELNMIDVVISENGVAQNSHFDWDPAEVDCCDQLSAYTCIDPCGASESIKAPDKESGESANSEDKDKDSSQRKTRKFNINWRLGVTAFIPSLQLAWIFRKCKRNKKERDYDIVQVDGVCCWKNTRSEGCWKQIDCKGAKVHYRSPDEYFKAKGKRPGNSQKRVLPAGRGEEAPPGGGENAQLLYTFYPQVVDAADYQQGDPFAEFR